MANLNFNKCIIGGRLTADPEIKMTTTGKKLCSFAVAVNRKKKNDSGEKKADFLDCTAWDAQADIVGRFFHKGNCILVSGSMQKDTWKAEDGSGRSKTYLLVNEVYFVDTAAETAAMQAQEGVNPYVGNGTEEYEAVPEDDDIPF